MEIARGYYNIANVDFCMDATSSKFGIEIDGSRYDGDGYCIEIRSSKRHVQVMVGIFLWDIHHPLRFGDILFCCLGSQDITPYSTVYLEKQTNRLVLSKGKKRNLSRKICSSDGCDWMDANIWKDMIDMISGSRKQLNGVTNEKAHDNTWTKSIGRLI